MDVPWTYQHKGMEFARKATIARSQLNKRQPWLASIITGTAVDEWCHRLGLVSPCLAWELDRILNVQKRSKPDTWVGANQKLTAASVGWPAKRWPDCLVEHGRPRRKNAVRAFLTGASCDAAHAQQVIS